MNEDGEMSDNYLVVDKKNTEIYLQVDEVTIDVGIDQRVVIDKLFGPLAANTIRIHLDYDSVCWIIERERTEYIIKSITKKENGVTVVDNDIQTYWDEVARIDANVWGKEMEELIDEFNKQGETK